MRILASVSTALAGEVCDVQPVQIAMAADGAKAVALQGWLGNVTLVPGDGPLVTVHGTACAKVALKGKLRGEQIVVRGRIAPDAMLTVQVGIPAAVSAVTFVEHHGPMAAIGVPARVAVVSSDGRVSVQNGGPVRISYSSGEVFVDGITGDLVVDRLVGQVRATGVSGNAVIDRVTGAVDVTNVAGDLTVKGGDSEVSHGAIGGAVKVL